MHLLRSASLLRCALGLLFLLKRPVISAQAAVYTPSQTADIEAIRFVLAQYCYDVDNKDYGALVTVYTPDVIANVAPYPITNLTALQQLYATVFGNVTTWHSSSTEAVRFLDGSTANVTSYNQAVYLGPGTGPLNSTNISATYYQRYDDTFVKGYDGAWLIRIRTLTIFVSPCF